MSSSSPIVAGSVSVLRGTMVQKPEGARTVVGAARESVILAMQLGLSKAVVRARVGSLNLNKA